MKENVNSGMKPGTRLLTTQQVLARLNLSRNSLKKLIEFNDIHPVIFSPNCHRYLESEIDEVIARRTMTKEVGLAERLYEEEQEKHLARIYGCDWNVEAKRYQG